MYYITLTVTVATNGTVDDIITNILTSVILSI